MTTLNELKLTSRRKRYADGHQRLLAAHTGKPRRLAPQPSEHARLRQAKRPGPLPKSHKARRAVRLYQRLRRAGRMAVDVNEYTLITTLPAWLLQLVDDALTAIALLTGHVIVLGEVTTTEHAAAAERAEGGSNGQA